MHDAGVDLTVIGFFSYVSYPYSFKFLWAPLMDRYSLPFLGRRKGWIFLNQVFLLSTIVLLAFTDPGSHLYLFAAMALAVAFFSASQDIVIDAYKTEILPPAEFGLGAASASLGYRISAILVVGAGALWFSKYTSWTNVYLALAGVFILFAMLGTLLAGEPQNNSTPSISLHEAFWLPLRELLSRKYIYEILLFIFIYKIDNVIASNLLTPFFLDKGFSKDEIVTALKGFGFFSTIAGTMVGGIGLVKLGMERALWVFGILQALAGLSLLYLATAGSSYPLLVTAVTAENFGSGMGTAVYSAFLMSLCNKRFTGTQFALLTSLMAFSRTTFQGPTGWMAKSWGWEVYYIVSILVAIPGLLLLLRFKKWQTQIGS